LTAAIKPIVLVILDGWGVSNIVKGNAMARARLPNYENLLTTYPHSVLTSCGEEVGLPEGQMGNSEVGHMNIGAGRVVYQDLTRITRSIRDGSFYQNKVLLEAVRRAKLNNSSLHLLGLVSDGGVHSHLTHLYALMELAAREGLCNVYIHAFLDGRDVPPESARGYFNQLGEKLSKYGHHVATVMGRYYAMDRDQRWERVERAYNAIVYGEGLTAANPWEAVDLGYARGETDEFIQPTVLLQETGEPVARVEAGDSVIFFNFRPDRARQLTRAFVDWDFSGFTRKHGYPGVFFTCMSTYDQTIQAPVAFPPVKLHNTLGEVLSRHGIPQLRLAETEKYAHVTFFFNGGVEVPNPGEERILVPSPKVATYDLMPEMSAYAITEKFIEQLQLDKFGVFIINYANPDMVGHTGNMDAAVRALETVDECLGRVVHLVLEKNGAVLITADHGNADEMRDKAGNVSTAHSVNPVPFILIRRDTAGITLRDGSLQDIAPTILHLLGIPKPAEMTGDTLITCGNV
jgi:2,3-bisphosphoglycerate-independent phosphoglycerate mutase